MNAITASVDSDEEPVFPFATGYEPRIMRRPNGGE